jgi:hypothetical protein
VENYDIERRQQLLTRLRSLDPSWGSAVERMQLRFAADYIEMGSRSSTILRDIEITSTLSHSPELRHLAGEAIPYLKATRSHKY